MGKFLVVLLLSLDSFAQVMLSPAIKDIETLYPKNKQVLLQCVNNIPSKDKSLGCVDSFKYLKGLCAVVHENDFDHRYNRLQAQMLYGACRVSALGDNRIPLFFDLDAKGCVEGFETLNERLFSYNKNKEFIDDLMEDRFVYMYEKNSCKDFRTYVNFCNYVDGPNHTLLPMGQELMPKVDYSKNPSEVCKPKDSISEGLYMISHDLSTLISEKNSKAYDALILNYRSRMPAGKTFAACEKVRTGYSNFGCAKFEKIMDGEPAWRSESEMKDIRINNNVEKKGASNER